MINCIVIYNISYYHNIKIMYKYKILLIFIIIPSLTSGIPIGTTLCDICDDMIVQDYMQDAWGNKFHQNHMENGNFCSTCSRIISKRITDGGFQFNDGRFMCSLCESSIINSESKKLKSIENVLVVLSNVGIYIDINEFEVNITPKEILQSQISNVSQHHKETIKALTYFKNNKYSINTLWGLHKVEFEAVLAHELMHVWVDYNNIRLHRDKLEGFCNLGSALIYDNVNTKLSTILKKSMSESNDPVYGRGYKYMNSLLEKHGWEKLISILRHNHN